MTPTEPTIETLDPNFATVDPDQGTQWFDVQALGIEGRGFSDTERPYQRLPARAQGVVREAVWQLGQCSAGLSTRFVTDANSLAVRWSVGKPELALPHMPAVGVSGLDLYRQDGEQWKFLGSARPREFPDNEGVLAQSLVPARRLCRLYFPLYNELTRAAIGIPPGAMIARVPPLSGKPIVWYGTSITQGGCASRPGMSHINIVGRRLNHPTINLGFSGNGQAEPEVARFVAEIDAALFVVDTLGNIDPPTARERLAPFVRILRAAHPDTPIAIADHYHYPCADEVRWKIPNQLDFETAVTETLAELEAEGVRRLHRLPAVGRNGRDPDCTVDGTHPTDLGFAQMAEDYAPLLRAILDGTANA